MKIIETLHDEKMRLISLTIMNDDKKIIRCKPVRQGGWKEAYPYRDEDGHINYSYICSVCGGIVDDKTSFCPHCGAKMELEV